jgi:ferredoxin
MTPQRYQQPNDVADIQRACDRSTTALSLTIAAAMTYGRFQCQTGFGIAVANGETTSFSFSRRDSMSYVVCQPCHDCKYTDCVVVCPCDCFYQDADQLYIDPDHCIDCDACAPECPVEAIFPDTRVPQQWMNFIRVNAERSRELKESGGHITERQPPLHGPACEGP